MINWRGTGRKTLGTNSAYPTLATTCPNLGEITGAMRERPFVIVCYIAVNYPKLRAMRERLSKIPIHAILYSIQVSRRCLFRSLERFPPRRGQRSKAAPCLGRSFSSMIILENSYLSTRPANRTFDTYDLSRGGKNSPRAVSPASLTVFVFTPTYSSRRYAVILPRGEKVSS